MLALGCDLLLSANILTNENPEYGVAKRAEIIIESTPMKRIFTLERMRGSRNLYSHVDDVGLDDSDDFSFGDIHNYLSRSVSIMDEDNKGSRREAWKRVLSMSPVENHPVITHDNHPVITHDI